VGVENREKLKKWRWHRFRKPAFGDGSGFPIVYDLFRQERFFQAFGLYCFEKIGGAPVCLKAHRPYSNMGIYCVLRRTIFFHLRGLRSALAGVFKAHCGLSFWDDFSNFLTRGELYQFIVLLIIFLKIG
jgi:hypothetical protein